MFTLLGGTRPTNIKVAQLSPLLKCLTLSTGQHQSIEMHEAYPNQFDAVGPGGNLGEMTDWLIKECPDSPVVVFGDTRTALAGALAAKERGLPLVHVEAGLRCGDTKMPEEQNRIIIDNLADHNYCLVGEPRGMLGLNNWVPVGDLMYDAYLKTTVEPKKCGTYVTIHRAAKFTDQEKLQGLIAKIADLCPKPIVFPVHPHTGKYVRPEWAVEPVSYEDSLAYVKGAELVVTDSGGVSREACFANVPLVVLRKRSEFGFLTSGEFGESWSPYAWPKMNIFDGEKRVQQDIYKNKFGDGNAAELIAEHLTKTFS